MSRFRVANGMEGQVMEAFVNRPRMVEGARGYLGMDTFTDMKDEAVFTPTGAPPIVSLTNSCPRA